MVEKIIKNVTELPGVDGACILDKKGVILHNALPDFFLDDFLEDLSRRVLALYEAVDENYMPCDDYLLKFPQKYILLRRSRNVYILVAVDPSVNLISLRMVTNLAIKHLTPKTIGALRSAMAESEAKHIPVSHNTPVVEEAAPVEPEALFTSDPKTEREKPVENIVNPAAGKRQRMYRGVPY